MRLRNTLAILCLTLLAFGFNNCSNDTRFSTANKTKASSSSVAGNGTPYGGNTGNGTPYGGIRKGSYLAFSNTVCPSDQKESVEVVQNADNSLLVTANYECRNDADVIPEEELIIADSGTHVVYKGRVFSHELQEGVTNYNMRTNLVCHGHDTGGSGPGSMNPSNENRVEVIYYSTNNKSGNFSHFIDRISIDEMSGELKTYTQEVDFSMDGTDKIYLRQETGTPNLSMEIEAYTGTIQADYRSALFTQQENQVTLEMYCQRENEDRLEYWNDPQGEPKTP